MPYGFCTLIDHAGNVIAECDETALSGDMLAEASHLVTEDGQVLDAERVLLDF